MQKKLQAAVTEAEQLLKETEGRVSRENRLALEDEIHYAKRILNGEHAPFSRCQAFVHGEGVNPFQFALHHYSKTPSYYPDGQVYTTYGLQDAIEWYKTRVDVPPLMTKHTVLASSTDPEAGGLFTNQELHDLWKKAEQNPLLADTLREIREEADRIPLEKMKQDYERSFKPDDYRELNETDCPWSDSHTIVAFCAPSGTAAADLEISLSSRDNEAEGLGHVWLDDLRLVGSRGNVEIPNGGFENGLENWLVQPGGICRIETRPRFCGSQQASLYMENPDASAHAGIRSASRVPLTPGNYTLRFQAKIDGIPREGIQIRVNFYQESGEKLNSYETLFAKKSWPTTAVPYDYLAQCTALLYAATGDITYAEKTKIAILHKLDDFCQGIEYWQVYNERPGGNDSYGAVQGGRVLCGIAAAYRAIRSANLFSKEEKERLYRLVEFLLHNMLDLRDRMALGYEGAQYNTCNWQTDQCIGASMILSVLPDYPNREQWWNNAYAVLRGQMEVRLNGDGSWPESIRYHFSTLEHLATYAQLLARETGENWFAEPALQAMFSYSAEIQTPPIPFFGGNVTVPPFGDHCLNSGTDYALYAGFITTIAKCNPALAEKVAGTWKRTHCLIPDLEGRVVLAQLLLVPHPDEVENWRYDPPRYHSYPQAGLHISRHPNGNYLAIMSSPKKIGHGHFDQGSFLLFQHGVPMVADTGIEGYFDASTPWHICTMSHACLQFHCPPVRPSEENGFICLTAGTYSRERGLCDTPVQSRLLDSDAARTVVEIANPDGKGIHRREFTYDSESGRLRVQDSIREYDGLVTVSLPLAVREVEILPDGAFCRGFYGQNLQIKLHTPAQKVTVERGRSTRFFPSDEEVPRTFHLRVTACAADGVDMELIPVKNSLK